MRADSASALACLPRTFLGSGSAILTTIFALVSCVNVVQVRDVLDARIVAAFYSLDSFQRLARSRDAPLGWLTIHVSAFLPGIARFRHGAVA